MDGPAEEVVRRDANGLARDLGGLDCAYLDPPYNSHSYFSNYHVWETLVRWDRPEAYGVARKRADCRTTQSEYNSSGQAWAALADLVGSLTTPWIVASVSDEGFHDPADVAALLAERGHVASLAIDLPRYVGARIGIHNPSGERVGAVSHVRNLEYLIVSGPDRGAVERAFDGAGTARGDRARAPRDASAMSALASSPSSSSTCASHARRRRAPGWRPAPGGQRLGEAPLLPVLEAEPDAGGRLGQRRPRWEGQLEVGAVPAASGGGPPLGGR